MDKAMDELNSSLTARQWKLWIYTNYDCNLRCAYCVAKSGPSVPRRAMGLANVQRLVDEAVALGFDNVFFTGGEPFLLDDIYAMLAYSAARVKTTVLTNGMLFQQRLPGSEQTRLERLCAVAAEAGENLSVQVSLDGGCAEDHDAYRGAGSWAKTVEGLHLLQAHGLRVRLGTTETPVNAPRLHLICEFHRRLGIAEEDHFVRPLARRGFSREGLELGMHNLAPELTVNVDGVYWHPLSTDADMRVEKQWFPLAESVARVQAQLDIIARTGQAPLMAYNCG
jgi:MoaA/NifB/PqqE/SkfB family radical SAM enzyme